MYLFILFNLLLKCESMVLKKKINNKNKKIKYYMFYLYLGNVFGMIGVLSGVVVIFGLLKLFLENFI